MESVFAYVGLPQGIAFSAAETEHKPELRTQGNLLV